MHKPTVIRRANIYHIRLRIHGVQVWKSLYTSDRRDGGCTISLFVVRCHCYHF